MIVPSRAFFASADRQRLVLYVPSHRVRTPALENADLHLTFMTSANSFGPAKCTILHQQLRAEEARKRTPSVAQQSSEPEA